MLKHFLNQCARFIFPHQCILCSSPSQTELDLCAGCLADLPFINQACRRCGIPLAGMALTCGQCLRRPPLYEQLIAPFSYQYPVNHLITTAKFRNKLNYTKVLSTLLANELQQKLTDKPDLIIPVPLHRKRLIERGYNQALEIAKPISRLLNIPIDYRSCIRVKATQPQTGLAIAERKKNIKNAFHIHQDFNAKHLALVDDVVTTGNTINELCKILKSYGVERIQVWCCARTIIN